MALIFNLLFRLDSLRETTLNSQKYIKFLFLIKNTYKTVVFKENIWYNQFITKDWKGEIIMEKIIIALDGPSGSGKSTIAKQLSSKLDILYLDTGAMYRATALKALSLGIDTLDYNGVQTFIDEINLEIKYIDGTQHTFLDGEDVSEKIREPHVSMAASNISSLKCVRLKMVDMQRKIASDMSCVLDGRDIGSYVLPNADFKFYITASVDVRAERRYKELTFKGHKVDFDILRNEIEQRDNNDKNRSFAPLVKADDAIEIDTSFMTVDQVLNTILSYIEK